MCWQCLDLDKFESAPTEARLVNRAMELLSNGTYWAGVVFENLQADSSQPPPHVKYKIRMDIEEVERTNKVKDRLVTQLTLCSSYWHLVMLLAKLCIKHIVHWLYSWQKPWADLLLYFKGVYK